AYPVVLARLPCREEVLQLQALQVVGRAVDRVLLQKVEARGVVVRVVIADYVKLHVGELANRVVRWAAHVRENGGGGVALKGVVLRMTHVDGALKDQL